MTALVAATLLLVASHAVPSAPGVREGLVRRIGRRGFLVAYSLLSLLALGAVVLAFRAAEPGPWLYVATPTSRVVAAAGMALAVFLLVGRLTTRPDPERRPRGVYRICVAPGSLAVLLWTLVHLLNVGEARLLVVFAGLAVLGALALVNNIARASPAERAAGIVPFAGIVRGRLAPRWSEIGWRRLALSALAYAALLHLHPVVIGPYPLAGLM